MAVGGPGYKRTLNHNVASQVMEDQNGYDRDKQARNKKTTILKRVSLENLMNLKVDYAFKQLFGNEKNKELTVVFLNAILQKTDRNLIKDISFANTEIGGEYLYDKQSRLDLLVVTDADEWLNIEIQFTNEYNMIKRSLYYWSRTYVHPIEKGMAYSELRPVIAINILNFNLFHDTERFHTSYHLYEDENQTRLTNVMECHFIEMGKLIKDWKRDKLDPWNNVLARWLLMLGMVDHRNRKIYHDVFNELEAIAMTDKSLYQTFKNWEELSATQRERLNYESRLKRIMDEEASKRQKELKEKALEQKKQRIEEKQHQMEQKKQQVEERQQQVEQKEQQAGQKEQQAEQKEEQAKQKEEQAERKLEEAEQKANKAKQKVRETEKNTKEAIACNLLQKGLEVALVAESAGLTNDDVIALQRQLRK